jgi:hypothetical protein
LSDATAPTWAAVSAAAPSATAAAHASLARASSVSALAVPLPPSLSTLVKSAETISAVADAPAPTPRRTSPGAVWHMAATPTPEVGSSEARAEHTTHCCCAGAGAGGAVTLQLTSPSGSTGSAGTVSSTSVGWGEVLLQSKVVTSRCGEARCAKLLRVQATPPAADRRRCMARSRSRAEATLVGWAPPMLRSAASLTSAGRPARSLLVPAPLKRPAAYSSFEPTSVAR